MVNKKSDLPVFFGLSHMGQVFSSCWSIKIGPCYVFDTNKKRLNSFKNHEPLLEEPSLKNLKTKDIRFLKKIEDITNFNYIFFTLDTELSEKNGKAKLDNIFSNLKKILNLKFKKKTYLIISSQINPQFYQRIQKEIKINRNIKIFYLVDTLKMGDSVNRFLRPRQIIIGGDKKEKDNILKIFKKFKTKKIFIDIKEAIIVKMAINTYLSFSVTFANIMDDLCRQYEANYTNVSRILKNDRRIGSHAYINASLGFSGGHLERDLFYLSSISRNKHIKKIINDIISLNNQAVNKINKKGFIEKNIIKTLVVGRSYKKDSFSTVNSFFKRIDKKYKISYFDDIFCEYQEPIKEFRRKVLNKDLIIFNYASIQIKNNILSLLKNKLIKVININDKKIITKNKKNLINLFR
jgi:nucleotide sugar dehydrogenase